VQPTVFQEKKNEKDISKGDEYEEAPVYMKDVEPSLRAWIEAEIDTCRRDVADEEFGSGVPRKCKLRFCCLVVYCHLN